MIPEVKSSITEHYTDDLSYEPVSACQIIIIAMDNNHTGLNCAEVLAQLAGYCGRRVGSIFILNDGNHESIIKQVNVILPLVEDE